MQDIGEQSPQADDQTNYQENLEDSKYIQSKINANYLLHPPLSSDGFQRTHLSGIGSCVAEPLLSLMPEEVGKFSAAAGG